MFNMKSRWNEKRKKPLKTNLFEQQKKTVPDSNVINLNVGILNCNHFNRIVCVRCLVDDMSQFSLKYVFHWVWNTFIDFVMDRNASYFWITILCQLIARFVRFLEKLLKFSPTSFLLVAICQKGFLNFMLFGPSMCVFWFIYI